MDVLKVVRFFNQMAAIADKAGWQKYFKIMVKLAQTMKRATNASMAYIPCCSIVLMCYKHIYNGNIQMTIRC